MVAFAGRLADQRVWLLKPSLVGGAVPSCRRATVTNVRSNEMEIGRTYILLGRANRKVTVLETPAELRSAARVRVRFENGVKADAIAEIPSRRIARPWREEEAVNNRPRRQVSQPVPVVAERPARAGDTVTVRGDESGLQWTVEAIDGERATLRSKIFGRPSTRKATIAQLQVHEEPGRGQLVYFSGEKDAQAGGDVEHDEMRWAAEHLSPQRPKRDLDRILDQLVFSQGCLRIYRRRLAPDLKGEEAVAERLRQEIRHKGYLVRGEELPGPERARLRVRRRFDIVLNSLPPPDEAVMVNWIHFPAKQKARLDRQRRRRAA